MKTHLDFAKYPLGVETASQPKDEEKRRENELDTRRQQQGLPLGSARGGLSRESLTPQTLLLSAVLL